ncbi:MAG: imidazolonepropionase [Thermoplasmata archaeon]|nr:imidazolonepropionase [Thermoplasmata archaeon]
MIRADRLLTGFEEIATLSRGAVPRVGVAQRALSLEADGAIAIDAGKVVAVESSRAVRRKVELRPRAVVEEWPGAVAVPGFIDAHTHVLFGGDRHGEIEAKLSGASFAEIARSGGGIYSTVRATRSATDAELVDSATQRLRRMARSGTVAVEVKSGYALSHAGELRLLRLVPTLARRSGLRLVPTYLGAHARPPGRDARSYLREIVERTLPAIRRERLARFCDAFCEPGFYSVAESERILRAAQRLGLGLKLHADEFVDTGGAQLAARLAARSAEHLLAASRTGHRALARAGVTAVLLPVTPFASLSELRSPGRELVDAGVPVALGSDCSPNSWVESMPLVIAHAVYRARLTPAEALTAATVNAAHASGLPVGTGTITVGQPADFSVFSMRSVAEIPYRIGCLPAQIYRRGRAVLSTELRT